MAQLVGAFGSSHGPMLSTPPDMWGLRRDADVKNPRHFFRGKTYAYPDLLAQRAPGFAAEVTPVMQRERHGKCQAALGELARRFEAAKADLVVIVGNDQKELFLDDVTPAMTVFFGETIENIPATPEERAKMGPGIAIAEEGHCPPGGATYPGAPEFGRHLVEELTGRGFDVAQSSRLPDGPGRHAGMPHAFGFLYRQVMRDAPPPSIPLIMNVGVAPNNPRIGRCLDLGRALRDSIRAWPGDSRVVLMASGGFSHFVIDEDLDRRVLDAMQKGDEAAIRAEPETSFLGNTAEIKNWLPVASAMQAEGRRMELVDYVPCYRSEAGTGNAMVFAHWA
ncbi:OH-DDVA oxygenase [Rhizobiales bacterium GAS113]|nr:OH-DDVA oxygenase [Rhizobiales bacterium GAS113]